MTDNYIQLYGRQLWGLCLTLCRNTCDAEDLYQEMWFRFYKNIKRLDKSGEPLPYLTKICVNIYRNMKKRDLKNPVFDNFSSSEEKDMALSSVPSEEKEDHSELHCAIDALPQRLRICVILFYFEDMDVQQTSKVLNIPAGTVKSRLNKARKLLKEMLKNETDI
ncbi:MAG: sigma-70 family RNA polymerase sigma factor [Clostridia bacterium]|nr:sigma-70 family RNA polymerase sigma factor [Clostridia bacterium]